jgi:hypothetical protein
LGSSLFGIRSCIPAIGFESLSFADLAFALLLIRNPFFMTRSDGDGEEEERVVVDVVHRLWRRKKELSPNFFGTHHTNVISA